MTLISARLRFAEAGEWHDLCMNADRAAGIAVATLDAAGMLRHAPWWRRWIRWTH